MQSINPWKTLNSKLIYKNKWLTLREDNVIKPNGEEGIYGVVELSLAAGIVAINESHQIVLVGQWRYVHNKFSWEIPTGGSEAGESILSAAKRELLEETGLEAEDWMPLGVIDNSNGVTTDVGHLFLATTLTQKESHPDDTEEFSTKWIDFSHAVEMVMNGEITESCSVAAILKADRVLHQAQ